MKMEYDFESTTTFKIKYLGSIKLKENNKTYYPSIIDGAGNGMLDMNMEVLGFQLNKKQKRTSKKKK